MILLWIMRLQLVIIFMDMSSSISLAVFHSFGNDEKLVALLVYSSFGRVATSNIWKISVATSNIGWIRKAVLNWGVNMESLRIHHSVAARYSNRN